MKTILDNDVPIANSHNLHRAYKTHEAHETCGYDVLSAMLDLHETTGALIADSNRPKPRGRPSQGYLKLVTGCLLAVKGVGV